ncbi:hypothetical protein FS837_011144 [Tulasnella sp. UAMH 9824]|nr:hypothetical protein FS837_011144 [Tulasnella sp. UAMH 9824]
MLCWSYGVHLLAQANDEALPKVLDCDLDGDTTRRHSVVFKMHGEEDDERAPLSPELVEAAFTHANLRCRNDSDATRMTLNTMTPPPPRASGVFRPPTQQRQPSFFYPLPNTPTHSRVDTTKTFLSIELPLGTGPGRRLKRLTGMVPQRKHHYVFLESLGISDPPVQQQVGQI